MTGRRCAAQGCDRLIPDGSRVGRITCSTACRVAVSRAKNRPDDQADPCPKAKERPAHKAAKPCRCGGRPWTDPEGDTRCLSCGRSSENPLPEESPPLRLAIAYLLERAA
jgi:hypothetical protein